MLTKLIYVCAAFRVEKYRPQKLDDLISHKDILSTSKLNKNYSSFFINQVQIGLVSKQNINIIRMLESVAGSYLSNNLSLISCIEFSMPIRCDKSGLVCSFCFFPNCFSLFSVQRFISEDKLPHLLFYGPPGTGKTSTILACARQLYKDKEFNSMVLEVRCSSSLAAACKVFPAPVQCSP